MYRVILDPNLFECEAADPKDQQKHFMFLKSCITFLSDLCNVSIDMYDGAPYFYKSPDYPTPPVTKSHYIKAGYSQLRRHILKLQNSAHNYVDICHKTCAKVKGMQFITDSLCKEAFLKYMSSIYKSDDIFMILGPNNNCTSITVTHDDYSFTVDAIYNPSTDCTHKVYQLLKDDTCKTGYFHYLNSCEKLNEDFLLKSSRATHSCKLSLIKLYGEEFASRNRYIRSVYLTKRNPNYTVFLRDDNGYAISLDLEHGGLELFEKMKSRYRHLGEYNFSGIKVKPAEPQTHKLNT